MRIDCRQSSLALVSASTATYPGYFLACERLYVVGGAYGTIELKKT